MRSGTLRPMVEDVTPSDVRARQFDITRRGYDRAEVEGYLGVLADEIDRLRGALEEHAAKKLAVGLDDPEALALELGVIGEEISKILEAARVAAVGMRTRAASDVDEWRSTIEMEMLTLTAEATEQSQSMRASAWNEGSSMLSSAVAAVSSEIEAAKEEALFIRAEAEREAIRLTGDARRDREESARAARIEAEQVLESARAEGDGILDAASKQAEQAQERTRALEDRRAELLTELESTRASIGKLEEKIDSRRRELDTPEPDLEPEPVRPTLHSSDGGSVRIVASKRSGTMKPVDADELMADVAALRSAPIPHIEPEAVPAQPETVAVIAPPLAEAPPTTSFRAAAEEPPAEPESSPGRDEIESLFASLKEDADEETQHGGGNEVGEGDQPLAGEVPTSEIRNLESDEGREAPDSILIPIQNAALKDIKRMLVDLQSDALEYLRADGAWTPAESFTNRFNAPFAELAVGITGSKVDAGAAQEFSEDLREALISAIGKARESGAGDRQTASDVSRVFRMWRADEAERRVVDTAQGLSS